MYRRFQYEVEQVVPWTICGVLSIWLFYFVSLFAAGILYQASKPELQEWSESIVNISHNINELSDIFEGFKKCVEASGICSNHTIR